MRICPICNKEYKEPPAISRVTRENICPTCGMKEALTDYFKSQGVEVPEESSDK